MISEDILILPQRLVPSSWIEHTPFAFHLIKSLKPQVVVELGVHNGMSLCAFAQAAKLFCPSCKLFGVDSFAGDIHVGEHGNIVYEDLQFYIAENYPKEVKLLKMFFREALNLFEDHSIDLLHIDGRHDYESVKEDYESWKSKVKPGGIIIFHDIEVRNAHFGVWKLWSELADQEALAKFSFSHGYGLGVLALGKGAGADIVISLQKGYHDKIFEALGCRARKALDSMKFYHLTIKLGSKQQEMDLLSDKSIEITLYVNENEKVRIYPHLTECLFKINSVKLVNEFGEMDLTSSLIQSPIKVEDFFYYVSGEFVSFHGDKLSGKYILNFEYCSRYSREELISFSTKKSRELINSIKTENLVQYLLRRLRLFLVKN